MTRFYLVKDRKRHGPFTIEELATSGLERTSLVWRQGMTTWMRADLLPELSELVVTIPPPIPVSGTASMASEGESTQPFTFQVLYVWFAVLISLSAASAGVATVGYILWLEAKTRLIHASAWDAFWNSPFTVNVGYGFDPFAFQQFNSAAWLILVSLLVGGVFFIPSVVLAYVFLYKSWSLVQDSQARTTPGMAVGFLFLPFFNLYWVFVALYGLACELNRVAREQGATGRCVSTGLALACCILLVSVVIPGLHALVLVPATVLLLILFNQLKAVSMRLAQAKTAS